MSKIGIIGLGLMGGSLAKSLKKVKSVEKILAYDEDIFTLKRAKEDGIIDEFTECIDKRFQDLDFIFLCTPVNTIYEFADKLAKIVNPNCIITDIGSTKEKIVKKIDKLGINFVGGHPMIGRERFGYAFSSDDLYNNAYYILTKTEKTNNKSIEKLKELLIQIHVIPIEMELEKHDFYVATISHVPHIIASGLINLVKSTDDENMTMKTIAAGGLKDITRIASANPDMWKNICMQNKEEILLVLEQFQKIIDEFKKNIDNEEETLKFFQTAKEYRDNIH